MDNHTYLAWQNPPSKNIQDYVTYYGNTLLSEEYKNIKYDIWVGEWSLATDVCAMWLGGFNESDSIEFQFECEQVDCPVSYLPEELAVDFDRKAPVLGPHGTSDRSLIKNGKCLSDSLFFS